MSYQQHLCVPYTQQMLKADKIVCDELVVRTITERETMQNITINGTLDVDIIHSKKQQPMTFNTGICVGEAITTMGDPMKFPNGLESREIKPPVGRPLQVQEFCFSKTTCDSCDSKTDCIGHDGIGVCMNCMLETCVNSGEHDAYILDLQQQISKQQKQIDVLVAGIKKLLDK